MTTDFEAGASGRQPDDYLARDLRDSPGKLDAGSSSSSTIKRVWLWVLPVGLAIFALGGAFGAGVFFERQVLAGDTNPREDPVAVFDVAWDRVLEHYVDEDAIDEARMLEAAIEGMLATLGDEGHTRYLTAEETEIDRQSSRGVYQGIGVLVREDEEQGLIITRVYPNSPASEEELQPGDVIVGVDGQDVRQMELSDILTLIRGPEGTRVDITVYRPAVDSDLTFNLERREIEISAVSWTMLESDVALLRLTQFSDRAGEDLTDALQQAKDDGAQAIILDLRGNPGGLVREAMEVAALFVPDDAPVYISRSRDGGEETHRADQQGTHIDDLPLVVLVDESSASASEIVSGSIQAEGENATVIGERTVGTGTVLRRFELGDGSTIWLGFELWLTPEGRMIREQGISPDIVIPLAESQIPYAPTELPGEEPAEIDDDQLNFAIDFLLGRKASQSSGNQPVSPVTPW